MTGGRGRKYLSLLRRGKRRGVLLLLMKRGRAGPAATKLLLEVDISPMDQGPSRAGAGGHHLPLSPWCCQASA